MDAVNHPALLLVDGVSSIGALPFKMDEWRVDVAVTGAWAATVAGLPLRRCGFPWPLRFLVSELLPPLAVTRGKMPAGLHAKLPSETRRLRWYLHGNQEAMPPACNMLHDVCRSQQSTPCTRLPR